MSTQLKWSGQRLTKADLLEFLGRMSHCDDDTVISVSVEPHTNHPSDPGGMIRMTATVEVK